MREILLAILLTTFLASCGTINPLTPKTDMNKLVADVQHGDGNDYVGETIKIDATVADIRNKDDCYLVILETNDQTVSFPVETCDDKYVKGATYTFQVYIRSVKALDYELTAVDYYIITGELK